MESAGSPDRTSSRLHQIQVRHRVIELSLYDLTLCERDHERCSIAEAYPVDKRLLIFVIELTLQIVPLTPVFLCLLHRQVLPAHDITVWTP
jgi:hypothetical protein